MMITKIGVIGCGTMGAGIAWAAAQHGYETVMLDIDMDRVNVGFKNLQDFSAKSVAKGKMTEETRQEIFGRIKGTADYDDMKGCQLVIEAAAENLAVKKAIFGKLEELLDDDAILASNTSTLPITKISADMRCPERAVGMHFFNPPQIMKLVEIISSEKTEVSVRDMAAEFVKSLGKTPIQAKDNPGFIVNYLQLPYRLNAIRMVQNGMATPEDIDTAAKLALGHPMGPLELQDLVGLDITYSACQAIFEATGEPWFEPPQLMKQMLEEGRLGRKTGRGFYEYE